ncbi:polysaccharide pyruvyl transferase family protein [Bacillus sp. RO2]|uniref:polysaccharide pyruvyl transferase family protein n=1 Tax=Bacillus sp. RO2 TaxID=2723913 RepID=UPI00145E4432|nr:polysaccharide pyruvyl transferase family protein [Bacillus sp. RO2]NMH75298.1 polysaccharide pyruvyl transferase family protein [Bacillus sp. RO2]
MKKIFVDIYLQFNLGDDLFLDILVKNFPDSEFTINYLGKNYDKFISNYQNLKRRKYTIINKIGQKLKLTDSITNYNDLAEKYDGLLFIGGAIFREEDYHPNLYKDRMNLVKSFKEKKKSVFILGANFGPFITQSFINDYRRLFKLCDDICFRDKYSYNLFKDLKNVRYAPDIVFQLNPLEYESRKSLNKIGISIIDVRHKIGMSSYYNNYITSTVSLIEKLSENGYEVCLISFCEFEGDMKVISDITKQLTPKAKKSIIEYNYQGNIKEAIKFIASLNLLIAARFHANILGLVLKIGMMPIIYSQKTTNVLNDINFCDVKLNMNELDLQYNEKVLEQSFNNKADSLLLRSLRTEAKAHFLKLESFLMQKVMTGS